MTSIIGIISQKGGVGKSTLARGLAREIAAGGLRVKIADLDVQQATSTDWNRARLDAGIEPVLSVEPFKTAAQAIASASNLDALILDGPARTSSATLEMAKAAGLLIQPSGASLDDLRPAVRTFIELTNAGIDRSRLAFALCRVGTDAEELDARQYIGDAGFVVLDGCLHEKPAYRRAQNEGRSITETPFPTLNKRADALLQAIVDRMGE